MFDDSFDTSTKETTTLSYQPTDTCDDDEGFHKFLPGELIKGRYSVLLFIITYIIIFCYKSFFESNINYNI
jgi:hypothetical protein